MSLNVTPLSHSEAVKQIDHCYVINNSTGRNERPRGIMFLSVKDGDREQAIEIPATWIPIDLYSYVSPEALRASVDFRTLIRENHLVAISEKEADNILSSSSAKTEAKRVSEVSDAYKKTRSSLTNGQISISTGGNSMLVTEDAPAASSGPNPQFLNLIESFNNGDISDDRASEQLRGMVNSGVVTLQQLQMSAMKVKNTGSMLFRTIEGEISALASGTARGTGGAATEAPDSF